MKRYRFPTERRNHSWAYTGEDEWLDSTVLVRGVICTTCGEQRQATNPIGIMGRKGCVRETRWNTWQIGDHVSAPYEHGGRCLMIFDGWASPVTARLRGFAGGQTRTHASNMRRP